MSNYLQTKAVTQTYIVGGPASSAAASKNKVAGPARLAGGNRYETIRLSCRPLKRSSALKTSRWQSAAPQRQRICRRLTGAVLAARTSSPLILTAETLPAGTAVYLQSKLTLSSKTTGLGGKLVVPASVLTGIIAFKEDITVAQWTTQRGLRPGGRQSDHRRQRDHTAPDVTLRIPSLKRPPPGPGHRQRQRLSPGCYGQGKTIINGGGPNMWLCINFNGPTVVVDVPDGGSVRLVAQAAPPSMT